MSRYVNKHKVNILVFPKQTSVRQTEAWINQGQWQQLENKQYV